MVDLRELAERLGMLKPCEVCGGWTNRKLWRENEPRGEVDDELIACPICDDTGLRLPTEAEVRAAIRAAGVKWIETGSSVMFAYAMFGGDGTHRGEASFREAAPANLVLLALLRALQTDCVVERTRRALYGKVEAEGGG